MLAGVDPVGLAAFALVGLLGGAHCIGMCGPLVGLYADRMGESDRLTPHEVRQHALFNLGRTGGYALVGAVVGGLGSVLFDATALVGVGSAVRGVAGVAAGVAVVLAGANHLVGAASRVHDAPVLGDLFGRLTAAVSGRVDRWAGGPRIVGLGAAHALMPCPLLYPAYLAAFALGSPVRGALSLAALGLGTVPALFLVGTALGSVSGGTRARLHRALGVAFVLLGLVPLSHGLATLGLPVPMIPLPHPEVTDALLAL